MRPVATIGIYGWSLQMFLEALDRSKLTQLSMFGNVAPFEAGNIRGRTRYGSNAR